MSWSPDTIAVRAYTERADIPFYQKRRKSRRLDEPSDWTLVFDTETNVDAAQSLRVGFYQLRKKGDLKEEGAFYHPETLSESELETLTAYCARNNLRLRTFEDFNTSIFLKYGYGAQALIVGFNLPFDISRIALRYGIARRGMRGGFCFILSEDKAHPDVRIKHLSPRASLVDFASPGKQETARSSRKRGRQTAKHRGYFIDLKTLAAALTSQRFSLETLCKYLSVVTEKKASSEHGQELTETYLDYARGDVQSSWECLCKLLGIYRQHGLDVGAHRILSEASIGKAYLQKMNIEPLAALMDVPRHIVAKAMESYYGGRAEVRIRRKLTEVIYCDFKSMYPTVNALMGLWEFVIGDGMRWKDATDETRRFLEHVQLDDLQIPQTWRALRTLVRVKPDADLLPIRARYDQSKPSGPHTIGLNYLTFIEGLWFTLADVVAAKIHTEKVPEILEAVAFEPGEPQMGLRPINLFGNPEFRVDPRDDDAFKRLIDLRDFAKTKRDSAEKAIKIVANSTSYGIFIEILRDNAPKPEPLMVFGSDGPERTISSTALEEPGRYFNPVIGTLITGAARLMLGLAERLALNQGLSWAFCDTDSLAIARPNGLERAEFTRRVGQVIEWFEPLNPYEKPGSILQIEDVNLHPKNDNIQEPLYAFAISAKRYALCNFDEHGRPLIRKASAHGLGHLQAPYRDDNPAIGIPAPTMPLEELGVSRWQYDLWYKVIEAAQSEKPWQVPLDYHPALQSPAASRYTATSPELLNWMSACNADKPPIEQVSPFCFMLRFMGKNSWDSDFPEPKTLDAIKRGRPAKPRTPKPVAAFDRDPAQAAKSAIDRDTGEGIPTGKMKTYAEVLRSYHLSPEHKFENGDHFEDGETRRRNITAVEVKRIGKEANAVDSDRGLLPELKNNVEQY